MERLQVGDHVLIPENVKPFTGWVGEIVSIDNSTLSTVCYVVDFGDNYNLQDYDENDLSIENKMEENHS